MVGIDTKNPVGLYGLAYMAGLEYGYRDRTPC